MKKIVLGFIFFSTLQLCFSQPKNVESELKQYLLDTAEIARLQAELRNTQDDSSRLFVMKRIGGMYSNNLDSGLHYAFKSLSLARKINFRKEELSALAGIENQLKHHGMLLKAFNISHQGLQASRRYGDKHREAGFLGELGQLYRESGVFKEAMTYLKKCKNLYDSIGDKYFSAFQLNNIGEVYLRKNELDSALLLCRLALKGVEGAPAGYFWITFYTSLNLGDIFMAQANYDSSLHYLRLAKQIAPFHAHQFNTNLSIAKVFDKLGMKDSTLYYAGEANRVALESDAYSFNAEVNDFLGKFYYSQDLDKSVLYTRRSLAYKDSLYKQSVSIGLENFEELDLQERQFEIQSAQAAYQFRARLIGLLTGVLVLLVIIGILVRNYRQKQKSIVLLNKQKDEINRAKEKTETAMSDLKAAQSQLIQSEKMASLGELTAGIAHEIQNPLNFVNNFSELNKELLGELKSEVERKNLEEIQLIAINIESNEEKIRHHGQRADAIVKSMLQHSRANSGKKELTDLNVMCDEYARLAYHGLRAKDKSANVKVETHFDPSLSKVGVVSQDIGRVVLNLINNAFYTVIEKNNTSIQGYMPTVKISTKQQAGKIEIHVEDNGTGIPDSIKEKIFQPFFTTKPTGHGTGLGLSLSYDIVKAHGGELIVRTDEGVGSEFIIRL